MLNKGVGRFLLASTAAAASTGAAHAAQTPAGTVITNQARASYTVNGTAQQTDSNRATFKVDRKVNFTVVSLQATPTPVNLNQTEAVTRFKVTNLTNGIQDFLLDPDQQNLSVGVLPGTDDFDLGSIRAYVDNGNDIYEPGIDTATFIDDLAPDASKTVFIVGNVPNQQTASLAFVSLHVTAAEGETGGQGAVLVPTDLNLVNQENEVDIIFADNDSDDGFAGDIARNGQGRAYAAYSIGARSVALTVAKSSRVVSDGVNLANFKALPGAVVEYCLVVRNATPLVPATNVTLSDVIPEHTTYVPGSIRVGGLGVGDACVLDGQAQDDDNNDDSDPGPYRGGYDGATRTVTTLMPSVLGGTALSASFQVTIN